MPASSPIKRGGGVAQLTAPHSERGGHGAARFPSYTHTHTETLPCSASALLGPFPGVSQLSPFISQDSSIVSEALIIILINASNCE